MNRTLIKITHGITAEMLMEKDLALLEEDKRLQDKYAKEKDEEGYEKEKDRIMEIIERVRYEHPGYLQLDEIKEAKPFIKILESDRFKLSNLTTTIFIEDYNKKYDKYEDLPFKVPHIATTTFRYERYNSTGNTISVFNLIIKSTPLDEIDGYHEFTASEYKHFCWRTYGSN